MDGRRNMICYDIKEYVLPKIVKDIQINYTMIPKKKMKMGSGIWNQRCHNNAVQQSLKDKSEVYLCYILTTDNTLPIVHFINKKRDKFYDTTLGYQYNSYKYYIVRKVEKSEYDNIGNLLIDTKRFMVYRHISKFRLWLNCESYRMI
jgi:hypothetical protein